MLYQPVVDGFHDKPVRRGKLALKHKVDLGDDVF
jgi:hypothetical protein